VKRIVYSAIAALVALLILAPTVLAQQTTGENTTMMAARLYQAQGQILIVVFHYLEDSVTEGKLFTCRNPPGSTGT